MFSEIKSLEEFLNLKDNEPALLAYFSTEFCNVCKVLKPKVAELIAEKFPQIKMVYIQSDKFPDISAQNQIFIAPTIIIYFNGREFIRKSRNIGIGELQHEIQRPYSMLFEN